MKLFKRMAAAAMAAVLSLSVLTACGGGGGTGTTATRLKNLIAETKQSDEFYMEMRDIKTGNIQQEGIGQKYTVTVVESSEVSGWIVVENAADFAYKKVPSDPIDNGWGKFGTWASSTAETYFNESIASILRVDPKYEIEGVGTFYAEYFSQPGSGKLVYCFDGGELKYFVAEYEQKKIVYEVKLEAEIPQKLKLVIEDFEAWKNAGN